MKVQSLMCKIVKINRKINKINKNKKTRIQSGQNTTIEPAHDETSNKTCVTSKDSAQLVHPSSMARVLVIYPSFDSLDAVEGTDDPRRL